jgi:hypothetical protein
LQRARTILASSRILIAVIAKKRWVLYVFRLCGTDGTKGEFYTEGTDALLHSRRKLAKYSLSRCVRTSTKANDRARARIAKQRIEVGLPLSKIVNVRKELFKELKVGSQYRASRTVLMADVQQPRISVRG